MVGGISSATARIIIEATTAEAIRQFNQLAEGIKKVDKAAQLAARNQERMLKIAKATSIALLGFAAAGGAAIVSSVRLAARVQTLGVVTVQLGKNVGRSEKQMRALEQSIVSQGITLQAARQSVAMMIQAQVDLARATELARLAQDTAVIANVDSSEAFKRVIAVIQTGNIRMGRTLGLQLSFEQAYIRQAKVLGKNVNELTQLEKIQARTNEVISQGQFIAGTYEAAMTTAGKRVLSLNRHVEESRRIFGEAFLPIFVDVVMAVEGSLKQWQALDDFQQRGVSSAALAGIQYAAFTGIMLRVIPAIRAASVALLEMGAAQAVATAGVSLLVAAIGIAVVADAKRRGELKAEAEAIEAVATENKKAGKTFVDYSLALRIVARETGRTVITQKKFNELAAELAREKHISLIAAEIQLLNDVIIGMGREEFNLFQFLEFESQEFDEIMRLMGEVQLRAEETGSSFGKASANLGEFLTNTEVTSAAVLRLWENTNLKGRDVIADMRDQIAFMQAGGAELVIQIGAIETALVAGLDPDVADKLLQKLDLGLSIVEEEIGKIDMDELVRQVSEEYNVSLAEARDIIAEVGSGIEEIPKEIIFELQAFWAPIPDIILPPNLARLLGGITVPIQLRTTGLQTERAGTVPGVEIPNVQENARGGPLGPITKVGEQGFEFIIGNQVVPHEQSRLLEQLGLRASRFGQGGIVLDPGQGGGGAPGPIGTIPITTTAAGGAGGQQTQQAQATQTVSIAAQQQTQAQGAFASDVTAQVGKQVDEQKRSTEELGGKLDQIVEEMVLLREELPRTFRDAAALEVG